MKYFLLVFLFADFTLFSEAFEIALTSKNNKCASECVKQYGILQDYWRCWTGYGISEWDYCTKSTLLDFQYFTSQHKTTNEHCYGPCGPFGSSNHWCFTNSASNEWDYCSLYPGQNYNNEPCSEPCLKKSDGYKCINSKNEEKFCSPAPDDSEQRKQINSNIALKLGTYEATGFVRCFPDFTKKLELSPNLKLKTDVDMLIGRLSKQYPSQVLNYPEGSNGSVTSHMYRESPPIANTQNVLLTLFVTAKIRPTDLSNASNELPSFVTPRMKLLNSLPTDDSSQLLPLSIGGPKEKFNYIPLTSRLKAAAARRRKRGASIEYWPFMEKDIKTFLQRSDAGYVSWKCVVLYGDLSKNRRPEAFAIRVRKYLNDDKLHEDSDDLYFSNHPDKECRISYTL